MTKLKLAPIILFFIFTVIIFYKLFFLHLFPIPTNLLVSFYFPWNSGSWQGYEPFTTHKEFIGADAIRQHLPWLKFSIDQIKSGELPLWNPYNFSGSPNIANIQTFIFYPLSFVFLFLPLPIGWSFLIVLQVFLGQVFMYIFLKKIKISTFPAILASLAFVSSTYFIYNLEINIIGHALIWLPLLLYSFENLQEKCQFRYFILSVFCFAAIFLAGHPQTAILISTFFIFYIVYKYSIIKKASVLLNGLTSMFFGFCVSSLVVIPSIYLFMNTPLNGPHSKFDYFLIPFKNLLTFFAPDLFGNPATNNFKSTLYGDGTPHIGPIVLFFAISSLFYIKETKIKFFALVSGFFIIISLATPIAKLIEDMSLPVISSSNMSRNISVALFSLCVLSAYGFEKLLTLKKINKNFNAISILFLIIYATIWTFSLIYLKVGNDPNMQAQFKVAIKNLVIPTAVLCSFFVLSKVLDNRRKIYSVSIILISSLSFFYSFNKTLPFSERQYFFPDHPAINFLKQNASINRFYGEGSASFGTNFASYYKIYSPEGYSLLRSRRYAELVAASRTGTFNDDYSRSDADFPTEENGYRKKIFNLLGVKYLLNKNDLEDKAWNPEPQKFPKDQVKLVWQEGKFKIYEREDSLPRVFLTNKYQILEKEQILKMIYDKDFDLKTILLEKAPPLDIKESDFFSVPKIDLYQPNKIVISTDQDQNSLLFISDAYYTRWKAKIDGYETEVLVADYALRAVAVPAGNHKISFEYLSVLFPLGITIMSSSIILLSLMSLYFIRKKMF